MEIQEQQFVRELAESRMQIELLRNRVLLRYYAQSVSYTHLTLPTTSRV